MSKFNIGTLVKLDSDEIALSEDAEFLSQYIGQSLKIIDVKKSESFGTFYTCEDEDGTKIQHSAYTKKPIDFNFVDADFIALTTSVSVRYLKAGNLNIEVPNNLLQEKDKLLEYCENKIQDVSDEELLKGLSDFEDYRNEFFDENPEVEQITDVENDYKELFSTTTWDMYSDHEYAKNILAENENMASYLSQLGLTQEEISNICYGGSKKRGSIDVTFVSLWDGDTEIKTPAKLNVDTGEVYDITEADIEKMNLNLLSLQSIRLEHASSDFDVIENYENMDYAIDPGSLHQINSLILHQQVSWANEGIFHTVTVKGRKFYFQLDTGACDEPIQPFNGNVLIDDGEDQFMIFVEKPEEELKLIEDAVVVAIKERYFSESLQVENFNGLSVNSNDLLKETKNLLLHDNADWIPSDIGGLIFKKETLTNLLEDDFFDDEDRPISKCLKEIKNIISFMTNAKSSILYLY